MNKLILVILLFAAGLTASAQDWSKIFAKYNHKKGVESVYISPAMFQMIGRLPEMEIMDHDVNLTSALVSLKGLYVLESEQGNLSGTLLEDVRSFVKSAEMELIMSEQEKDEHSEIYVLMDGDKISCLLLVSVEDNGEEVDVIVIEGKLSMDNFKKLINKSTKK